MGWPVNLEGNEMGNEVVVADGDQLPFGPAQRISENVGANFVEGIQRRFFFRGDNDSPQFLEVRVPAGKVVEPHAHTAAEIIFVLEGELKLSDGTCRAGSAISVPANTVYGFAAGADGCRFLNFRTHSAGTLAQSEVTR
jgi:quercetin dioxygenase-like cupin family protein